MYKPFCFLHIPRTAGTTLNKILSQNFEIDQILSLYKKEEFEQYKEITLESFEKIKLIQGHILLQNYDPPRIYSSDVNVFTFLREPVARIRSEYFFLKQWKFSHMYEIIHKNNMSFIDYITSDLSKVKYKGKNFMTRAISGEDLASAGARQNALSQAKRHLEKQFVFFGIQEKFDESLVMLSKVMSLKNILYERRNVLSEKCKETLSSHDVEVATHYNSLDVELYKFACELFVDRLASKRVVTPGEIKAFATMNAKYQKLCDLLNKKSGMQPGEIMLPK
ncbi:MAG TPA: sulfotransferase family 2 domain-containing protein [Solidesulfovibrio magneticus]|nr:sulfotransferase family 2 domain-containing protein [Solidesulfovibrio magneticus]